MKCYHFLILKKRRKKKKKIRDKVGIENDEMKVIK